jgi:E1A/CREB-binding protein
LKAELNSPLKNHVQMKKEPSESDLHKTVDIKDTLNSSNSSSTSAEPSSSSSSAANAVQQQQQQQQRAQLSDASASSSALPSSSSLPTNGALVSTLVNAAAATTTATTTTTTTTNPTTNTKCKSPIKFKADELRDKLMPTFDRMYREPEAIPFQIPVNPVELNLPDYFTIIKRPMDLSTIRTKLDEGKYSNPQEYVDDVWLMLNNAWMYNKKTSKVYKYCTKLSEIFSACIDPVMQSMGYCCGQQHTFSPQVLFCYGNQMCCTIPRDGIYYLYNNDDPSRTNCNCEKYTFCLKCFENIKSDAVPIGDDPSQPLVDIKKSSFVQMKNDHEEQEACVECSDCGRKWHQICALYMESIYARFTCDTCIKEDKTGTKQRQINRYTSTRLQRTRLGDFLESRVNTYLNGHDHHQECQSKPGKVTIRILSSVDKICETKAGMKQRYEGELVSETYPFRTKAIFAFEEIDGVDVVFFGMHVQEYGSECPQPNTRRVYISYLDSVFFFRPKELRTAVYHELLIGYLDYAKQAGYQWAHIWACPPSEGDDYIFHCHPPDQKVPKPKRLQDWYKKMLDKGIIERVVIDYKDIHKDAVENGVKTPIDLPYFEGTGFFF